jgi:type III pantothenate kinase
MITLCFDFGNTRLKCAVFSDSHFKDLIVLEDDSAETIIHLLEKTKAAKSILSSVVDHNPGLEDILSQKTLFHKLSYDSKLPFTSPVGKPHTIGADRLAMVAAGIHLSPNQHNLIIGLGSCITYNFVNKYHEFIGGSISPGMEMRFKSLQYYTAKLPLIEADWNFPLLGYDTKTNIQSGVILGMAKEIDGTIDSYRDKFSNFNVHLTGGDVAFFGALLKNKIFADPFLIYRGLYAISEYNQKTKT